MEETQKLILLQLLPMIELVLNIAEVEHREPDEGWWLGLGFKVGGILLKGGQVIIERRYTNAPPERLHTIRSVEEWNAFARSFLQEGF